MLDYKYINIPMVGEDGNAMFILARVRKAMKRGGCTPEEITEVSEEMRKGDYNHLLFTVMEVFSVDGEGQDDEDGYFNDLCEGCAEPFDSCDCEGDCS